MNNVKTYVDEQGNKFTCEVIETFRIEELNKSFLAYIMNDVGSQVVDVRFVELLNVNSSRPTIKAVDDNDVYSVHKAFSAIIES